MTSPSAGPRTMRPSHKYVLLGGLYVAQTLPGHFFSNVFSVILRDHGASLASIGYLQVIALPWMLKFLWAPLVDRLVGARGRHVRAIVLLEALFCLITLSLAFLDFATQLPLVVGLMALSYVFAATQDIVTDAMAIRLLSHEERGPGNAAQTGGNVLGVIVGSGLGLIAYQHLGWSGVMIGMALFLLLPLLPLGAVRASVRGFVPPDGPGQGYKDMLTFFRQPGAARWALLMLAAQGGSMPCIMLANPLLVDLGFAPASIGLLTGIHGVGMGLLGALAGGLMIRKFGRRRTLTAGCLLNTLAALGMLPLARGVVDLPYLLGCLGLGGVGFSLVMTAINAIAMDYSRRGREGADYSLQIALSMVWGIAFTALSGSLAQSWGYFPVFALCAGFCLGAFVLVARWFEERPPAEDGEAAAG